MSISEPRRPRSTVRRMHEDISMRDEKKTKKQLIEELVLLRREISKLKTSLAVIEEVSHQKQAAQKIEGLSQELSVILGYLPVACFMAKTDGDHALTYLSENIKALTGFEAREFISNPSFWVERIHPEDRAKVSSILPQLLENQTYQCEYRWRTANDTYRWFHEHNSLRKSAEGENYIVGLMTDITERKQAEEALRDSEQRYRALAESSREFIFILDKALYVRYVNTSGANLFGCRPEEIVGKRIHELFPADTLSHMIENIQKVFELGRWTDRDLRITFPSGTLWLDTYLIPLEDESGESNAVLGISRDITYRKEVEKRLIESERSAHQLAEENRVIARIGRIISSTLNLEEVFEPFIEEVRKVIPFDRMMIGINHVRDNTMTVGCVSGIDIEGRRLGDVIVFPGEMGDYLARRRPARIIRLESENGLLDRFPFVRVNFQFGIRSLLSIPLIQRNAVIGNLYIESVDPNTYTQDDLELGERIGAQIGGAIGNAQLFSERKRSEEKWRESEAKYRALVENAPIGICLIRGEKLIFANSRMVKELGYSEKELTSMSFWDIVYPDQRGNIAEYFQKSITGEPLRGTYRIRVLHKDGRVSWRRVDMTMLPEQDQPSQLAFLMDITDRVEKEEELRKYHAHLGALVEQRTASLTLANERLEAEIKMHLRTRGALSQSERHYQDMVDTAQEGICLIDHAGKADYVNFRIAEILDYSVRDMLGQPITSFMDPTAQTAWEQYFRQISKKKMEGFDFKFRNRQGEDVWTILASTPRFDETGQPAGALLMITDITGRRKMEEKIIQSKKMLQKIFDGISEPLIMLSKNFVIRMLNQAAKDYYQVETFHQIIGKPLLQDFLESDQAGREVRSAISDARALSFERTNPSDSNRFERIIIYPLRMKEEVLGDAILRISDITESRLLQQEIIQNEKLASLGLLITSIAHEINNPNNFISFNVPILREYLQEILPILDDYANLHPDHKLQGMDYPEFREDLSKLLGNIEHGTSRINTVVSNLREFSRKKDRAERRHVHLREVVEKGMAICAGELKKKVKSVDIDIPEDLPMVLTDPGAVEQILINLLVNAIQATDKEASWIKVRAMFAPSRTDVVQIEVSDNGCGMDGKTLRRIFEPFYTTKSPGTGTGLGLYVSQNLIIELGGEIMVESQPGMGSTFRVHLPVE